MISYFLVRREADGSLFYWKYGQAGGWTLEIKDARRYAKRASAAYARFKLMKRPGMLDCQVEAIDE